MSSMADSSQQQGLTHTGKTMSSMADSSQQQGLTHTGIMLHWQGDKWYEHNPKPA